MAQHEINPEINRPAVYVLQWLYTVGTHSTSIPFPSSVRHLQFWFQLCAAKYVHSNTWQAHWTCTGSLSKLQKVTDGQNITLVECLMYNSDCNPSQSSSCSASPSLHHPRQLERAVVLSRSLLCPSPSTFSSVLHSIYFIAPLHLIALTS